MPALASAFNFNYKESLSNAMEELAQDSRTLFLGQGTVYPGHYMLATLQGVPEDKRIELPVMEEAQIGMSIGLSLTGYVPISIFPRWNFLLLAANQLINHLDKMRPHVIVRVGIGTTKPLDPGDQHKGDHTDAFRRMMPNTYIARLEHASDVIAEYRAALYRDGPSILVEIADLYS